MVTVDLVQSSSTDNNLWDYTEIYYYEIQCQTEEPRRVLTPARAVRRSL